MLEHTLNAGKLLGTGAFLDHLSCLLMLKEHEAWLGFCQEFVKCCNLSDLNCYRLLILHVALPKCFVFDFSFVSVSERSVDEHLL